jgi:hypothetical protein
MRQIDSEMTENDPFYGGGGRGEDGDEDWDGGRNGKIHISYM